MRLPPAQHPSVPAAFAQASCHNSCGMAFAECLTANSHKLRGRDKEAFIQVDWIFFLTNLSEAYGKRVFAIPPHKPRCTSPGLLLPAALGSAASKLAAGHQIEPPALCASRIPSAEIEADGLNSSQFLRRRVDGESESFVLAPPDRSRFWLNGKSLLAFGSVKFIETNLCLRPQNFAKGGQTHTSDSVPAGESSDACQTRLRPTSRSSSAGIT